VTAALGFISSKTTFCPSNVIGKVGKEERHLSRLKRMRRTVLNSARLLEQRIDSNRYYWVMVTLTYAPEHKWMVQNVSGFIQGCRDYLKATYGLQKLHYVWVMELQKRGAPHYHVLLRLPHGMRIPKPDKSGLWFLGHTEVARARHAVGYLAKYASKGDASTIHRFPKGSRLHGASSLLNDEVAIRSWWNLPQWVRETVKDITFVTRIVGGVVVNRTGEFLPTPFDVINLGGSFLILRKPI